MKTSAALALVSLLSTTLPAAAPSPRPSLPPPLREVPIILSFGEPLTVEKSPRAPVTFLGVEAVNVDDTLAAQLGLPENTGLKVISVQPDSPAASELKRHDVLTKFRDQILIEPSQLGVLVRACKEGEEVAITHIRAGKEAVATVKLAQRSPASKFAEDELRRLEAVRDEAARRREARERAAINNSTRERSIPTPRVQSQFGTYQTFIFKDDAGTVFMRVEKQERALTIKDAAGKILFEGPISTEAERAKIPAELLPRLEQVENSSSFKIYLESQARLQQRKDELEAQKSAAPKSE